MEVLEILQHLEDMMEQSSKSLFSSKVSIDKEIALSYIRDIRVGLPEAFKQAEWISNERQRIIDEAMEEARQIIKDAENKAEELVQEHIITQKAEEKAKETLQKAVSDGNDVRNGAISYAQDILEKLGLDIERVNARISANYEELEKLKFREENNPLEE